MPGFGNPRTGILLAVPLVLAAAAAFAVSLAPVWDYDVWFQLACGRAIVSLRGIPAHDLFSYTAAQRPWDSQEWLFQIFLYGVSSLGGVKALILMKALVCALIVLPLFYRATDKMADPWLAGAVTVWAVFTMRWNLVERPQLFTMLFLALELLILSRRRGLWLLIPLALLWANVHGGASLLCPGVLGIWIACEYLSCRLKKTGAGGLKLPLLILLALFLALLINPAGWRLFVYPFETMADRMYMANIREWIPPVLDEQPAFFLFLGITTLLLAASITQFGFFDVVIAAVFLFLAFSARRHVPLFVVAASPLVARALTSQTWGIFAKAPFAAAPMLAIPVMLAFPSVLFLKGAIPSLTVKRDLYPAGAVENLIRAADSFRGTEHVNIYNVHKWGGYLTWHLPGKFRIFIDGRQLVYGQQLFLDYYLMLEDKPEAFSLIEKYSPDLYVLDYGTKLGRRLAKDPGFALVYWDDTCLVYSALKPKTSSYIKEGEYRAFNPETGRTGAFGKALEELSRAASQAPCDARPFTALSTLMTENNRPEEAAEAAREALARKPGTLPVVLAAARTSLAARDLEAAGEFVRMARKIDPRAAGTLLARAHLALAHGLVREADEALSQAIEAGERHMHRVKKPEPSLADAYRLKALRLLQDRRNPEAAEALRKAGNADFELGRPDSALDMYRKAAALAPFDVRIRHNIGSVLLHQGDLAGAEDSFRKALELSPSSVETLTALGVVCARTGRKKEAARMFQKALQLRPGDAEIESYLSALERPGK